MQALTVEIKKFEKKFTVMVRMKKILEKLGFGEGQGVWW
jgi:hypothetical protein